MYCLHVGRCTMAVQDFKLKGMLPRTMHLHVDSAVAGSSKLQCIVGP